MAEAIYPSLHIRVVTQSVERQGFALVDTGFDGHLAVPEALIRDLPQPSFVRRVQTASGQVVSVPAYIGAVELTDHPGQIQALIIALGDEFLLGLSTLNHFKVTFDHGQTLIVEA